MRRWILMAFLVVGLIVLLTGTAAADNGPHTGDYPKTTDACAGCHRAHRGKAANLLKEATQQALCFSCHGSTATGADTDVEDGIYENRASGGQYGTVNAGLRGGGFVNAWMDPGMTGTPGTGSVTSKHSVGETGTIWGNGNIGSGAGKTGVTLECGSCHNPHGTSGGDTYRVLRPRPKDSGVGSDVNVTDESTKKYTVEYWSSQGLDYYRDIMDADYLEDGRDQQIAEWCAQCHTRYLADDFNDSDDGIFKYRHVTHVGDSKGVYVTCLACHVAHGTSATMGTNSGAVEWPDSSAGGGSTDSRLLHVNSRGVCIQCHEVPGDTNKGCLQCHQVVP